MNILFVINKLQGGGAERVVARLASHFCDEHNVYVALTSANAANENIYEHDKRIRIVGLTSEKPGNGAFKVIKYVLYLLRPVRRLKELKKLESIDLSISFLESPSLLNTLSSAGEKTIVSVRNMLSQADRSVRGARLWKALDSFSGKRADKVVCVSRSVAAEQKDLYGIPADKLAVIYNSIDPDKIKAESAGPVDDEKFNEFRRRHSRLLISAGRLHPQKVQWQLIRCMKAVLEKHPDTGLVILGKGKLKEHLQNVIDANGLHDHVYLAGYHLDPFPYYGKTDVFVMTSHHEGFSNSMLEAAACGLPIVSTDCVSGPRELLAPDTDISVRAASVEMAEYGILTPVFSSDPELTTQPLEPEELMFADAVSALLSDASLIENYSRKISERAGDYAPEKMYAQWEALIEELC